MDAMELPGNSWRNWRSDHNSLIFFILTSPSPATVHYMSSDGYWCYFFWYPHIFPVYQFKLYHFNWGQTFLHLSDRHIGWSLPFKGLQQMDLYCNRWFWSSHLPFWFYTAVASAISYRLLDSQNLLGLCAQLHSRAFKHTEPKLWKTAIWIKLKYLDYIIKKNSSHACLPKGHDTTTNSLGMDFVRIEPGTFMMGSP